ncbi:MAG TPA: 5'-methylthioadenosine/S-adenosylhomocysteine nucleosidase [Streptosporangiaceae bacterium]|jgi:nucleoside phosphorylase
MPSAAPDGPVDVAILAALAVERAAIVDAMGNCSVLRWRGLDLHVGDIAGQQILVYPIDRMGNVAAAQATEQVIRAWHPARLILVGIAAGAPGSLAEMLPGDILIPDQIVGYELAKVTRGGAERRYEVYRSDVGLLEHVRSLRSADWAAGIPVPRPGDPSGRLRPLIHIGPVLTGDKVIADGPTLAELRLAWPKAIAVEMESLGVALAAYQNGVGFLMIKAVSDFADEKKNDEWHRYAAFAAARFAVAVLTRSPKEASQPKTTTDSAGPGEVNVTGDDNVLYTKTSITTGVFTGRDSVGRQRRNTGGRE